MSLLNQIKNSVSEITINNLSKLLEEDVNGTKQGLNLGITSFLASIIKFANTEKSAKSLLGILTDGGHTGDIINNFESFSGNIEKARLLETIGGNIVSHFLDTKGSNVSDKISELGGITKANANSLLNLSAPLVLGFLGRTVRENNFNANDIKSYLQSEGSEVSSALPMALSNVLNLPSFTKAKASPFKHNKAVSELNKSEEKKKSFEWGLVVPWILLGLLGLLIYYFTKTNYKQPDDKKDAVTAVTDTLHPEDFLPIDTLKKEMPLVKETSPTKPIENKPVIVNPEPVKPKAEVKPESKPVTKETEVPAKKPVEKTPVKETAKKAPVRNNTPSGLSEISGAAFVNNSAEIKSGALLSSLVSQLKSSGKKITISPLSGAGITGSDRAWALKEHLSENGVPSSQIEIGSTKQGNNAAGVAYRLSN